MRQSTTKIWEIWGGKLNCTVNKEFLETKTLFGLIVRKNKVCRTPPGILEGKRVRRRKPWLLFQRIALCCYFMKNQKRPIFVLVPLFNVSHLFKAFKTEEFCVSKVTCSVLRSHFGDHTQPICNVSVLRSHSGDHTQPV